jgi:hypothetical protein
MGRVTYVCCLDVGATANQTPFLCLPAVHPACTSHLPVYVTIVASFKTLLCTSAQPLLDITHFIAAWG